MHVKRALVCGGGGGGDCLLYVDHRASFHKHDLKNGKKNVQYQRDGAEALSTLKRLFPLFDLFV